MKNLNTIEEQMRLSKRRSKLLKIGAIFTITTPVLIGGIYGIVSSAKSSALPEWQFGSQTKEVNYENFDKFETNEQAISKIIMDGYYLDGDGNRIADVKDYGITPEMALPRVRVDIEKFQKEEGIPWTFVYKFGNTEFKNNYIDVFNEKEWAGFIYWFVHEQFWGPEMLALDSFSIERGISKDGTQVTLGQHSGSKDSYNITFYPDSFFGAAPVYSSDPSLEYATLVKDFDMSTLYGIDDTLIQFATESLGLEELRRKHYKPKTVLGLDSAEDNIVRRVVNKKGTNTASNIRSFFKILDPKTDPYYLTCVELGYYDPKTDVFKEDFETFFMKKIYTQWYMQPRYLKSKARVNPHLSKDIPEISLPFVRDFMGSVGLDIFGEEYIKTDKNNNRVYKIYYEKYPKLMEKLGTTLPKIIKRKSDDENVLSLSANIPILYLQNYQYNELKNEYILKPKEQNYAPGVEWLKYVTQHEYGHHITLNALREISEGNYTYPSAFAAIGSQRNESALMNFDLVSEFINARGIINPETGLLDPNYYEDPDNPGMTLEGDRLDPIFSGLRSLPLYSTFTEFFLPETNELVDNIEQNIYIDYNQTKVYYMNDPINDFTSIDLDSQEHTDVTELFSFSKGDFAWKINVPEYVLNSLPENNTRDLCNSMSNSQKMAVLVMAGKSRWNTNELMARAMDTQSSTLNPNLYLGMFNGNTLKPEFSFALLQQDGTDNDTLGLYPSEISGRRQTVYNGWDSLGSKNFHETVKQNINSAVNSFEDIEITAYFNSSKGNKYFFNRNGKTYVSSTFQETSSGGTTWLRLGTLIYGYEQKKGVKFIPTSEKSNLDFFNFCIENNNIIEVKKLSGGSTSQGDDYDYRQNIVDKKNEVTSSFGFFNLSVEQWDAFISRWIQILGSFDQDGNEIENIKDTTIQRLEPEFNIEFILPLISKGALSIIGGNNVEKTIEESGGYPNFKQFFSDYTSQFAELLTRDLNQLAFSPSSNNIYQNYSERNSGFSLMYDPIMGLGWEYDYQLQKFVKKTSAIGGYGGINRHVLSKTANYKVNENRLNGQISDEEIKVFSYKDDNFVDEDGTPIYDFKGRRGSGSESSFDWFFSVRTKNSSSDKNYIYWNYYSYFIDQDGQLAPLTNPGFYLSQPSSDDGKGILSKISLDYTTSQSTGVVELLRFPIEEFKLSSERSGFSVIEKGQENADYDPSNPNSRYSSQINFMEGDSIEISGTTFYWYENTQNYKEQSPLEFPGLFNEQPLPGDVYREGLISTDFLNDGDIFTDGDGKKYYFYRNLYDDVLKINISLLESGVGFYSDINGPTSIGDKPDLASEVIIDAQPGTSLIHYEKINYYSTTADGTTLLNQGFFNERPQTLPESNGDLALLNWKNDFKGLNNSNEGDQLNYGDHTYTLYFNYFDVDGNAVGELDYPGLFENTPTSQSQRPDYVDETLAQDGDRLDLYTNGDATKKYTIFFYSTASNGENLGDLSGFYEYNNIPSSYQDAEENGGPVLKTPSILILNGQQYGFKNGSSNVNGDKLTLQGRTYRWMTGGDEIPALLSQPGWFKEGSFPSTLTERPWQESINIQNLHKQWVIQDKTTNAEYIYLYANEFENISTDGWYQIDPNGDTEIESISLKVNSSSLLDLSVYADGTDEQTIIQNNFKVSLDYTSSDVNGNPTWLDYFEKIDQHFTGWCRSIEFADGTYTFEADAANKYIFDTLNFRYEKASFYNVVEYDYFNETQIVDSTKNEELLRMGWYTKRPEAYEADEVYPSLTWEQLYDSSQDGVIYNLVDSPNRQFYSQDGSRTEYDPQNDTFTFYDKDGNIVSVMDNPSGRYVFNSQYFEKDLEKKVSDSGWYLDLNNRLSIGWSLYDYETTNNDNPDLIGTEDGDSKPEDIYSINQNGLNYVAFLRDALGIGSSEDNHHDISNIWRDTEDDMVGIYGTMSAEKAEQVAYIEFTNNSTGEKRYIPVHTNVGHYYYNNYLGQLYETDNDNDGKTDRNDLLVNPGWDSNKDGVYLNEANEWVDSNGSVINSEDIINWKGNDVLVGWTTDLFTAGGYADSFLDSGEWTMEFVNGDKKTFENGDIEFGTRTKFNEAGKLTGLAISWIYKTKDGNIIYNVNNKTEN